jgi:YggT family protein
MQALVFLVDTLIGLYLLVLLLRLMLQLTRADFRNPIARALVQVTNPVIVPLRRLLPPVGRIDTASIVAILVVTTMRILANQALLGFGVPSPGVFAEELLLSLLRLVLQTWFYAIFLYALLSLVAPGAGSPAQSMLRSLCEPVLSPIRRTIPPIGGLDLSPLWAGIAIQALLLLLR